MRRLTPHSWAVAVLVSWVAGCGNSTELAKVAAETDASQAGGAPSAGGHGGSSGSGGSQRGLGGTLHEAGVDSSATGRGGAVDGGPGGATGTGGTDVHDGSTTTGGAPSSGGSPTTGGAPGSGGVSATGGVTGTDGASPPPPTVVTFTTDSYSVAPGAELYLCQNFENSAGFDAGIVSSESIMPAGGLDLRVFRLPSNASSGVQNCDGLELTDYVHDAAELDGVIKAPDGVGRFLSKSEGLRIHVHYLNTSSQPMSVQSTLKVELQPSTYIRHWASPIHVEIPVGVPPGSSTQSKNVQVPFGIEVFRTLGRMYSTGTRVRVTSSSAALLFDSTVSLNTPATALSPPVSVTAGTTLTLRCDYDNPTGYTLTYGTSATLNERCIFSGFFYPTSASNDRTYIHL